MVTVAGGAFGPGPIGRVRNSIATRVAMDVGAPHGGQRYRGPDPSGRSAVRFAAVGDVGTGDREEQETADAMASVPGPSYDALVLLGDNVYPSGDPARIADTVLAPFRRTLAEGADLVPVLGNHDVRDGNGPGQLAALGMPGPWYSWRSGPLEILVLDSTRPDDPKQLRWLQRTLAASDATWKIAALHHPPYSAGWHGSSTGVRAAFAPLFQRYGVRLVLAGHDHDYQRSVPIGGVTYVVSGAGAKTRPTGHASFTRVSWSTRHFLDVAVWSDRLEVNAIAQDGLVYDRFTLRP